MTRFILPAAGLLAALGAAAPASASLIGTTASTTATILAVEPPASAASRAPRGAGAPPSLPYSALAPEARTTSPSVRTCSAMKAANMSGAM